MSEPPRCVNTEAALTTPLPIAEVSGMATPIVAQQTQIITRSQALKLGLARYFTGKPCKRGHISERYSAGGACYACTQMPERKALVQQIGKRWRSNNPEKKKEQRKAWAAANPERKRQNDLRWYAENAEREKARHQHRYEADKDGFKARAKAWAAANPEKEKLRKSNWSKANRALMAEWTARYRASKRMATPSWANLDAIKFIYAEAKRVSDESGIEHHVDHIVPLISDIVCGLHCEANLRVLEGAENIRKSNRYWPDMP